MSDLPGNEISTIVSEAQLRDKLLRLAVKARGISKDGWNDFHKYRYASAATVYEEMHVAMTELGLISRPIMEVVPEGILTGRGSKGTDVLVLVRCKLWIQDVETGAEICTIGYGGGQDAGDKSVMKAQTAAMKYALINLLLISAGDDPEADSKTDASASGKSKAAKGREERKAATGDETEMKARAQRWMDEKHGKCKCGAAMQIMRVKNPEAGAGRRYYARCSAIVAMYADAKTEQEREVVRMMDENHDFLYASAAVEDGSYWKKQ